MSYQAVKWAMYDAPMLHTAAGKPDTTARQVLGVLAEHADEKGRNAYPGPLRISYATGLDERTIERALRRLEAGGVVARDGRGPNGTTRWCLVMDRTRPESEWDDMQAEAEKIRQAESAARLARRNRQPSAVSGTQNPGQTSRVTGTIRHAESPNPARKVPDKRPCPARKIPESGTQNPGIRHATPPEPPEPPVTTNGGTLPPDPLRHEPPPATRNEQNSTSEGNHPHGDPESNHRPRAREAESDPDPPLPDRCRHGLTSRRRTDGQPSCALCRRDAPPAEPTDPEGTP